MHELNQDGRLDLSVYNEATAWTLSSRRLLEEAPCSEEEPWDGAVAAGRLMALSLHQDDAFHVRVVLGELSEDEDESWLGRASWWLRIPDGRLVLAAGGEFAWGWTEEPDEDEFVHQVRVPPGDYRIDVHSTITGVNGLPTLERCEPAEALGAWWRRTRPEEAPPAWLQLLFLERLAEDPGHEEDWSDWSTARHDALLRAVRQQALIDWVVQLRPLEGEPPTELPELDEGCFAEPELRLPERCPRGLEGRPVNPEESCEEDDESSPFEALELLADHLPTELDGGPVTLQPSEIELAARIAWFASRDVNGELLVDGEELGHWAEEHLPADDLVLRTAPDRRFRIGFRPNRSAGDFLNRTRRLGPALAALPEGASLELVAAPEAEGEAGRLRIAGRLTGGGWRIERAWPPVSAPTLQAALDLAREADGEAIEARDDEELQLLRERWREEGLNRGQPLAIEGLRIGHGDVPAFTKVLASAVFAVRFGDTWTCPEPEDPLADDDFDEDLGEGLELFAALAECELTAAPPLLVARTGRSYHAVAAAALPAEVLEATSDRLEAFVAQGAAPLGDFVCSVGPSVLLRGLAHEEAGWHGLIMVAPFVGLVTEAYTRFADGSSLTTTTNSFPGGHVEGSGIEWNPLPPGTGVAELVASHRERVAARAEARGTRPLPARPDLLGLCEALEEFLVRRTG